METAAAGRALELAGPLRDLLPPVDFCCAYGSTLLHARPDGASMVDYILGVADPLQWHSENLERNPEHSSSWMARRGPASVTWLADRVGVGVYFNPFVQWGDKDLAMDVLTWDWFYLSGRLQKPVHVLVDNWDIRKVNMVNLKMATSASLLLLPEEFTEYDLYAQICSLSYMGDLRMLFAEDKDKVKKVVEGSFQPFQLMYRPLLQEYISEGILKTSTHGQQKAFKQVKTEGGLNASVSFIAKANTLNRPPNLFFQVKTEGGLNASVSFIAKANTLNRPPNLFFQVKTEGGLNASVSFIAKANTLNRPPNLFFQIARGISECPWTPALIPQLAATSALGPQR